MLLALRVLLAAVFLLAGVAKLADRAGTIRALHAFQLPPSWVLPVAVVLPLVEISTAVAIVLAPSSTLGASIALVLVCVFSAAIGFHLVRGRRPDCHCFGQVGAGPVGWWTLARNLALAAAAAVVALRGTIQGAAAAQSSPPLGDVGAALVVGVLALVIAEGWLLVQLLGQNGRLLTRLEALESRTATEAPTSFLVSAASAPGLPIGTLAPTFSTTDAEGQTQSLDGLRAQGRPVLLIFTEPSCPACRDLRPEIEQWQQHHAGTISIAVVVTGAMKSTSRVLGGDGVGVHASPEIMGAYLVKGTPSAVLIGADATIASPVAQGAAEIRVLVAHAVGAPSLGRIVSAARTQLET